MSGTWGVDTADYAWNVLGRAQQAYGTTPGWWGRYLPNDAITPAEVAWLHQRGIAILALWNGENDQTVAWGYVYGKQQAEAACDAWAALGAPKGIAIVVDVEQPWPVSGVFLQGWLDGCHGRGYIGGAYLNPISGLGHVAAWLFARENSAAPGVVYSSEPEFTGWVGSVRTDWYDFAQTPIAARADDVEYHQYSENELGGAIDLDVARSTRYLWGVQPPAPPAPTYPYAAHVIAPGALKTTASHSSDPAVDPNHAHVWLEVGAAVSVLGPDQHSDDTWSPVQLVKPEQVVHGWFLASHLRKD